MLLVAAMKLLLKLHSSTTLVSLMHETTETKG